jgi:hypothetical protein
VVRVLSDSLYLRFGLHREWVVSTASQTSGNGRKAKRIKPKELQALLAMMIEPGDFWRYPSRLANPLLHARTPRLRLYAER